METAYFSTWGPLVGPIRHRDTPSTIAVVASLRHGSSLAGQARACGYVGDPEGSVALFRLTINGEVLPGLWRCERRVFVRQ